jgi:hypothetical protein
MKNTLLWPKFRLLRVSLRSSLEVHPLLRVSSSCIYSQCVVHIVVEPCAKGHFIHAGSPLNPEFFFLSLGIRTQELPFHGLVSVYTARKKRKVVPNLNIQSLLYKARWTQGLYHHVTQSNQHNKQTSIQRNPKKDLKNVNRPFPQPHDRATCPDWMDGMACSPQLKLYIQWMVLV